jgi:hypothetical protein
MLALAWHISPTKQNIKSPPFHIFLNFLCHEKSQLPIQLGHEFSTRGDAIVLELLLILGISQILELLLKLLIVLGALKPSGSLVVHFGPWSNPVEPQEQQLPWLDHVDNGVDIVEDTKPDLFGFAGHHLVAEDD